MSNRVTIQPTTFVDYPSGKKSYGVRVYDNYGQVYINDWKRIPKNDVDILLKVLEDAKYNEDLRNIMDNIREDQKGMFIGERWYQWNEIDDCFIDV